MWTDGRTDGRTDGHSPPLILLGRLLEVDLIISEDDFLILGNWISIHENELQEKRTGMSTASQNDCALW